MNNFINIKKLKSQLSIQDYAHIMESLGITLYAKGKKDWIYFTGDKHIVSTEGSPKLYFYLDNKIYISYTSGASYDIISLTQRRLSLLKQPSSFIDAINFILSTTGRESDSVQRLTKPHIYDWEASLGKFIRFRRTGTTLTTYDDTILSQLGQSIPQAWLDEGISEDTLVKYQIGYYERLNATTIPCRDKQGNLIGIRCRHWQPNEIEQGKYRPLLLLDGVTSFKFPTNNVFFGINYNWPEIERTGKVMLVESEKAVMKLDTIYKEHNVALGMFGSNLGLKRRNELIKLGVNHVVYVPDNDWIGLGDEAHQEWEDKVVRFCKQFDGYAKVEIVWDNLGLLGAKENATDKDEDTWWKLYEAREEFCS